MTEPYTLSVRDAADRTGWSRETLYRLARAGKFEVRYLSKNRMFIVWDSLRNYIDSLPNDPQRAEVQR